MVNTCYPDGTDWSCRFTEEELFELREDAVTAAMIERSEIMAWNLLSSLTLRRIALCPTSVRPCATGCAASGGYLAAPVRNGSAALGQRMGSFFPHIRGGVWVNACGCQTADCSCSALSEVILPGPATEIVQVRIDGLVIAPSLYRLDSGNRLVSLGDPWPICQDMKASPLDPGSFEVTYYRGAAPDAMTRAAAGLLAAEFFAACEGGACRLPANVTSVSRQGVSYELQPPDFPEGITGIPEVDAVIRIYNPNKLKSGFSVVSPDIRAPRATVWGGR